MASADCCYRHRGREAIVRMDMVHLNKRTLATTRPSHDCCAQCYRLSRPEQIQKSTMLPGHERHELAA